MVIAKIEIDEWTKNKQKKHIKNMGYARILAYPENNYIKNDL